MPSQIRRLIQYRSYYSKTQFLCQDLWKTDGLLQDVDVVAVYGLGPIMEPLGKKLRAELRPGSLVVSNEFTFPDWTEEEDVEDDTSENKGGIGEEHLIHVYKVPCQSNKRS